MSQVTSGATLLRADIAFRKCMNFRVRASARSAAVPAAFVDSGKLSLKPARPFDLAQGRLPALLFEVLSNFPRGVRTRTSSQSRAGVRAAAAKI
jgi:hypothetical protein